MIVTFDPLTYIHHKIFIIKFWLYENNALISHNLCFDVVLIVANVKCISWCISLSYIVTRWPKTCGHRHLSLCELQTSHNLPLNRFDDYTFFAWCMQKGWILKKLCTFLSVFATLKKNQKYFDKISCEH